LGTRERGQLTSLPERHYLLDLFYEAVAAGALKLAVCEALEVTPRTLQRWRKQQNRLADRRTTVQKAPPANALTVTERQAILTLCNNEEYANLPPSQIVPALADNGIYVGSESTFYRVLQAENQHHHRGRSRARKKQPLPTTHIATACNQVWSWDITYLPSNVKGLYYYLYLIEDIYSRKTVGWEVHDTENGEAAAHLLQRTVLSESCLFEPLILHSDNGGPMKSSTLLSKMYELGITPSRGRPRVSNDNPYSEALFRTLKYCPQWPTDGFASLYAARCWVRDFVQWYNTVHKHSGIRFVTPAERHEGKDNEVLAKRHQVYQDARAKHPERWSGETRDWSPIGEVALNPDRSEKVLKHAA
jgi:putative transposase